MKFETMIGNAEETTLPLVRASGTNLAAAHELVPTTESALEQATDHLRSMEASIRRQESEYTAVDHNLAQASVTVARLRLEGALANLARAEQSLRYSDTTVAEVVADVMRRALPDVTTRATFVRPAESPAPTELPFLLIVQSTPAAAHGNGTVTGEAEVTYYRSEIHRPLDASAIQQAASELGFRLQPIGNVHKAARSRDVLKVRVDRAHSRNPVIPTIEERHIPSVASRFASDLAAAIRFEGQGITIERETGAYVSSHVIALADEAMIVSEDVTPEGMRTLIVESSVLVRTLKEPVGRSVADEIDRLVERFGRGTFLPGLGVIGTMTRISTSSVRREDDQVRRRLTKVNLDDMPVDTAKIGFENVQQVILRTTLMSAVGSAATTSLIA